MSYKHLSLTERELLLIHLMQGLSLCQIAKLLGRNKSTISRELASYKTIYRAIYAAMFDTPEQKRSEGNAPWQLRGQLLQSITPDRGREFQLHGKVTVALGVEFCVALGLTIQSAQKKVSKGKGVPAKKHPCFCCRRPSSMTAGFSLTITDYYFSGGHHDEF